MYGMLKYCHLFDKWGNTNINIYIHASIKNNARISHKI